MKIWLLKTNSVPLFKFKIFSFLISSYLLRVNERSKSENVDAKGFLEYLINGFSISEGKISSWINICNKLEKIFFHFFPWGGYRL